jgi:hypothetical protein
MSQGFRCYLEFELFFQSNKKVVVDIYAKKGIIEVLIEVGSLSPSHLDCSEERLQFLRQLMPHAKIWHITQWKNWINQFEFRKAIEDYRFQVWTLRTCPDGFLRAKIER